MCPKITREDDRMVYCKLLACVALSAAYGLGLWLAPFSPVTFLLGVPLCSWLATAFHELGHLLSYKLLRLEWKRMQISFLRFERGKKPAFDLQQRLFAGSCTCAYAPIVPYWRYCVALLSGSITGMLLAGLAFTGQAFTGGALRAFLLCFGVLNALHGAFNLLPFSADMALLRSIKEERENTA